MTLHPGSGHASAPPVPTAAEMRRRLDEVNRRIRDAGGDPGRVRVVAVTKGFGTAACAAAVAAGLADIGENYAQELLAKDAELVAAGGGEATGTGGVRDRWIRADQMGAGGRQGRAGIVRWHFLGSIQRRKVGPLGGLVHLWHGVARASEGEAISRHAPGAQVLVQVDFSGDPGRNGCRPEEAPGLVDRLVGMGLDVRGLMTVAPLAGPDEARRAFSGTRRLVDRLGLDEASMGMSADLELAVAEGATIVRVGSSLFGDRPSRPREQ